MTISNTRRKAAWRGVLYGPPGVGKTTWAATTPGAVFVDVEDGTRQLDALRVDPPSTGWTWPAVLEAVAEAVDHGKGTVVIDTVDAVERLIWQHICERDRKASIEDYGYGKGYAVAAAEAARLLALLDSARARDVNALVLCHSAVKAHHNPTGEDWSRYDLALHAKIGGPITQWAEWVLFATNDVAVVKTGLRGKGVDAGRVLHTARSAAFEAKCRGECPPVLPLTTWADFDAACGGGDEDALRAELVELAAGIDDDKIKAWVKDKAPKASRLELAKALNKIKAKVAEKENG